MKRTNAIVCGLALSALLAGCGSATDNLDFKVPAGYETKMSLLGQEIWMKGDQKDPDGIMMLSKLPVKWDEAKMQQGFTKGELPTANVKNGKVQSSQTISICGNHPALFVKASGTSNSSSGKDMNVEIVMTGWNDDTYTAMYMYPTGVAPQADAEAAVKNICLKKGS